MEWPLALAIFGFILLFVNWGVIISFLVYKYVTRGRGECKTLTPATRRRSRWEMSQSRVADSLDTNTYFSTTDQLEVSDRRDSLDDSSSPMEMSRRASPYSAKIS